MIDGIINVYKEQDFTSHDVVAVLRGILKQKKIGHTGTLDPMATGVLPVCLGSATKLCDIMPNQDKAYRCSMLLGRKTDTGDITGRVIKETEFGHICEEMLIEAAESFLGSYMQIPPMYSALKVDGKKLYEYARAGITVERQPREVIIYSLQNMSYDEKTGVFTFDVSCSKGTYIRTLCEDIGEKLGIAACMQSLERIKAHGFDVGNAHTLDEIRDMVAEGSFEEKCITRVDEIFGFCREFRATGDYIKALSNGNRMSSDIMPDAGCGEIIRVYDESGRFTALYEFDSEEGDFKVYKMFLS